MIDWSREPDSNWPLRDTTSPLFLMSYLGMDWEAGHDPAPPAWKASTLPAYATPSCSRSGRHDSNVHEPVVRLDRS